MQRGEHEVSRERGLYGGRERLGIADLANHDHVGILAKHRPQPAREREARLLVGLSLVDARQRVFDWIFDRDDVLAGLDELRQTRIQRRRLSASRWTGDEHHSFGTTDDLAEL